MEKLRKTIKAAAPDATEAISYQMPAFKDQGRSLVAYAAFKDHCSLFPMSTKVIAAYKDELEPFLAGKGTIRFRPDKPLPASAREEDRQGQDRGERGTQTSVTQGGRAGGRARRPRSPTERLDRGSTRAA